jgi:hypothetical protein
MKTSQIFRFFLIITVIFLFSCKGEKTDKKEIASQTDISEFIGQWTIDITGRGVGWLEVRQESEYLDADLLWQGGSVLPVTFIYLAEDVLYAGRNTRKIVRTKDAEGNEKRSHMIPSWLEIRKDGEKIAGYYLTPKANGMGLDSASFSGTRLPDVPAAPDLSKLKYGDPVILFNGKDLGGWKLIEEKRTNGWSVENGILINNPVQKEGEAHVPYGNIRTEQEFSDFNLKIEVNVPKGSNSGIYLCGRYEIQVIDSYGKPLDSHNMGGLYSRVSPTVNAEKPAGTWQSFDITLCDRHVTVILNGVTIIDNQPVYGPTGGALTADVFAPGPIYLQGDHGSVSYRNIVIRPVVK